MTKKPEKEESITTRPPIVVVLGHVDHGKSSLLEAIKDFKITAKESGGITQHIGAYQIDHEGKRITFIDTPGHEAFEAMRSRGAKIADIAILVVAAEEGIRPQTKEAISHIKKAGIPMIVAINKIDKPSADPEKVKRELLTQDVIVESMGGNVPSINTSATTKKGMEELLEMITIVAEMENLKTDLSLSPEGVIIESYLNSQRGPTTTLILQNGILREGDIIGTASAIGKIKTMEDFQKKPIKEALPSSPTIVLGFEMAPIVGEEFKTFKNIEEAKKEIKQSSRTFFKAFPMEEGKNVANIILKVDVSGSMEALESVFNDIPQTKATINVVKAEIGDINETDIKLAKNSGSIILGFRVKTNDTAQKLAIREKVRIMTFDIIYELAQTAREVLEKRLDLETVKTSVAKIKILATFKTERGKQIVGGKVLSGEAKRGLFVDVIRGQEKAGEGKIVKLQKDKEDVDTVAKGRECGILFEGNIQIQENDILDLCTKEKQKTTL
jgi:translation initiation factor IF-2